MISSTFYNKANLVNVFFDGKVLHFPAKDPSVTLEWYNHIVRENENLYTLAAKVFGKGLEYMWTYIADNNPPIHPDSWKSGDIIRLPRIIVRDSDTDSTLRVK
jgi:hypothetical protein